MIEGSGSVHRTYGSGSEAQKIYGSYGSGSATLLVTYLTKQESGGRLVPSSLAMASQSSPPTDKKKTVFCIRFRSERHNFVGSGSHSIEKKNVRTVTDTTMPFFLNFLQKIRSFRTSNSNTDKIKLFQIK